MAAWDDDFEQRNIRLEDMIDDLSYDGTTDYDWFAPGGAEREIRSAALTRGNATPLSTSALKGIRNGVFAGAAVWAVFFVVLYLGIHA